MSYISAIRKGEKILIWERTPNGRILKTHKSDWYFYTESDSKTDYKSMFGKYLKKHTFNNRIDFLRGIEEYKNMGKEIYESDIPPEIKKLSQLYYGIEPPNLHFSVYDIEIDYDPIIGFDGTKNPSFEINSISLYNIWEKVNYVMAIPPEKSLDLYDVDEFTLTMNKIADFTYDTKVFLFDNEKSLLNKFLELIKDCDVISGWHSKFFDDPYLAMRIQNTLGKRGLEKLSFKHASLPEFKEEELFNEKETVINFSGRVNIDYKLLYEKFTFGEKSSMKLDNIAQEVLPDMKKLEFSGSLHDLYNNDFARFVRYNIRDTEILGKFEEVLGFLSLGNTMYHNTTGLFHHCLKTLKNTEYGMVNYCHYELDVKVSDTHPPKDNHKIEGGYVISPKRGLHTLLASVDLTSLYPSAIRSNNISPDTLVGQFKEERKAWDEIQKDSTTPLKLTFVGRFTGSKERTIELPAKVWKKQLLERNWCISAYGTVFTLENKGILPGLLESWFAKRKETKKLSIQYAKESESFDKNSKEYHELMSKSQYYDRIQQVMKLQLNSSYGSLCNKYFKFYDYKLGYSTTATGQAILKHQTAKVNELLTGKYDYNGDAIIYGDTDSTYFKTYTKNLDDATKIGDLIGKKVNATFPDYMRSAFLCNDDYDKIIETDREIIGSSGIFMKKKMYIIHIVNDEGKKVDKVKAMGIALKKSTLPPIYKKTLLKFMERLLKGEDWDDIAFDIVEFEDRMKNEGILNIGLPIGVKNMAKYTELYEKEDKNARLPGNVSASIHWNLMRDLSNDKESIKIVSGTKIKVYYLKTTYRNKFKSIAIPTDTIDIPEWFIDYFSSNIDVDAQMERLIHKPLEAILSAIGKDVPTKQMLLNNSLVS